MILLEMDQMDRDSRSLSRTVCSLLMTEDLTNPWERGWGNWLFTAIFIMVVSPAVLVHDVSARAGDVSMGIAVFPIG